MSSYAGQFLCSNSRKNNFFKKSVQFQTELLARGDFAKNSSPLRHENRKQFS